MNELDREIVETFQTLTEEEKVKLLAPLLHPAFAPETFASLARTN